MKKHMKQNIFLCTLVSAVALVTPASNCMSSLWSKRSAQVTTGIVSKVGQLLKNSVTELKPTSYLRPLHHVFAIGTGFLIASLEALILKNSVTKYSGDDAAKKFAYIKHAREVVRNNTHTNINPDIAINDGLFKTEPIFVSGNIGTNGLIIISPESTKIQNMNGILWHEFGHLINNDSNVLSNITIIAGLSTYIALTKLRPGGFIRQMFYGLGIYAATWAACPYQKYVAEPRADDFACDMCIKTNDKDALNSLVTHLKEAKKRLDNSWLMSALDFIMYPSVESRIEKFQAAIEKIEKKQNI